MLSRYMAQVRLLRFILSFDESESVTLGVFATHIGLRSTDYEFHGASLATWIYEDDFSVLIRLNNYHAES